MRLSFSSPLPPGILQAFAASPKPEAPALSTMSAAQMLARRTPPAVLPETAGLAAQAAAGGVVGAGMPVLGVPGLGAPGVGAPGVGAPGVGAPGVGAAVVRPKFLGFVAEQETARLLETCMEGVLSNGGTFHVAGFQKTLAILCRIPCPRILLVDVTGEEQPLNALMALAELVDPGTTVIILGPPREIGFYRTITNRFGVREYVPKPLNPAVIAKLIVPYIEPDAAPAPSPHTGRVVAVTGARGGIGTTTIAANLAFMISHELHRHTLLLDTDLQTGTAGLALNTLPGNGLVAALQSPGRLDAMLIERLAQPAGDRLHLLAGQEPLNPPPSLPVGAARALSKALVNRFKFVVADIGARQLPFAREVLNLAHQQIMVLDPSMLSLRNYEKLVAGAPPGMPAPILILNQAGRPYGLSAGFMEQEMGVKFDLTIPDLPRILPKAEKFGDMGSVPRGPFRDAMARLAQRVSAVLPVERAVAKKEMVRA